MDLELVTVGTELLLGLTVNSNAAELGRALAAAGARVVRTTCVADDPVHIRDAVGAALARTRFVVVTGGLGPTRDDVTKSAVAELFGLPLQRDVAYERRLEARWRALGRSGTMPEANRTQALVPTGATVLPNPRGTAPGLWLEGAAGRAVLLPGVPEEMRGLLVEEVCPRLAAVDDAGRVTRSRVLRTTGMTESGLADRLAGIEEAIAPATLAYLPTFAGVDLRLTAWQAGPRDADRILEEAAGTIRPRLADRVYGEDDDDLAAVVLATLLRRSWSLGLAESCTGGLVGSRLTAVPGASKVFVGGVVAYGDAAKRDVLGVPDETLARVGAVSEATARAMARGAAERLGSDCAIGVTGIAGPEGGTVEKPVGTVCFAARAPGSGGGVEAARTVRFPGEREAVRARAAQMALDMLRNLVGAS